MPAYTNNKINAVTARSPCIMETPLGVVLERKINVNKYMPSMAVKPKRMMAEWINDMTLFI
jgi:hypothetical protein